MKLIIVESPTKAKTLSRFLGKDYTVEATMGHIKDLPKSKLGVDVEDNFKPNYELVPKRLETIKMLEKAASKADEIYLASDPDREGEAISSHLKEILGGKKHEIVRISFHEITKEAVEEAIANPRKIDENLVDAQTGRRVLDRLVGYNLSPLLWRKVRRGLSAGRVQTVAVRLIVEREREIKAFRTDEYWEVYVTVCPKENSKRGEFIVQLSKLNDKTIEVKNSKESSKVVSDLEKSDYKISDVKKREVTKSPYPPFTTSTMTQAAARLYGWSAKRTMSVAQRLYEEGHITYHRTDSTNMSGAAVEKVRSYIKKEYGDSYLPEKPRFFKTTSKVAQEAHEAIRPTNVGYEFKLGKQKGAKEQELLYGLIWRRFVACQMTPSIFDETTIIVEAKTRTGPDKYELRASGQILKFDGWKKLFKPNEDGVILPKVEIEEKLDLIKVDPIQKFTEPPPRYNEASLIKTLEKLGIGRPSTYAPTITTIQVRNYVEKEEGKFLPTTVGFAVNDFMMEHFKDIFDYAFTAEMEDDLDKIANGEKNWVAIIKSFWTPFTKKVKSVTKNSKRVKIEVEKLGRKCPECKKGELVVRLGRFGKFISCERFPDCKYTEKFVEKVGVKCPECKEGDVVIKKSGRGRKFFGCSRYPDCKYASWKNPKKEITPQQ